MTLSSPLLLDTHIIVWMATGDPRLRRIDQDALRDPGRELIVSSVVAFELTDLQTRGRIAMTERIDYLRPRMSFRLAALPDNAWKVALDLPDFHRDPVDRMLIAHALCEGYALATADANIRRYSVECI